MPKVCQCGPACDENAHRAAGRFERLEPLSPVVAHRRWSGLTCLLGFLIRRPLLLLALRLFFLLGLLQPVSLGALEPVVGFAHEASPIRRPRWAHDTAKEAFCRLPGRVTPANPVAANFRPNAGLSAGPQPTEAESGGAVCRTSHWTGWRRLAWAASRAEIESYEIGRKKVPRRF